MSPTWSGLVAAGLFLGQSGPVQVIGPTQTSGGSYTGGSVQQQMYVSPPIESAPRRPFLTRLRSWLGGESSSEVRMEGNVADPRSNTPYIHVPAAPQQEYPRRMPTVTNAPATPAPQSSAVPAGQPVSVQTAQPAPSAGQISATTADIARTNRSTPLRPQVANKVGRDDKFAWITGQLEVEHGTYVIYYATPETIDQYHGRLVLQPAVDMKQYRPGDLVTVEGQVQNRPGLRGGSITYRVANIGLVERATP